MEKHSLAIRKRIDSYLYVRSVTTKALWPLKTSRLPSWYTNIVLFYIRENRFHHGATGFENARKKLRCIEHCAAGDVNRYNGNNNNNNNNTSSVVEIRDANTTPPRSLCRRKLRHNDEEPRGWEVSWGEGLK